MKMLEPALHSAAGIKKIEKLYPVYKDYLWGGNKLKERYGKITDLSPCAESWELSFHADGMTRLGDGKTLAEAATPADLGTRVAAFPAFPLMIKLIDAKENLSVQVHPTDEYAMANENSFGKTEMWYIVEGEAGAGIYLGFSRDVTREEYEAAIKEERLTELLNFYPVKAGECYMIPAGTVHAIGAGCLICEIQQNSNLTYRVYDYGRRDKDGNTRPLHIEKALAVSDLTAYHHTPPTGDLLATCPYFHVEKHTVGGELSLATNGESFHALTCVSGSGSIDGEPLAAGDTFFVPATHGAYTLTGSAKLILTKV